MSFKTNLLSHLAQKKNYFINCSSTNKTVWWMRYMLQNIKNLFRRQHVFFQYHHWQIMRSVFYCFCWLQAIPRRARYIEIEGCAQTREKRKSDSFHFLDCIHVSSEIQYLPSCRLWDEALSSNWRSPQGSFTSPFVCSSVCVCLLYFFTCCTIGIVFANLESAHTSLR